MENEEWDLITAWISSTGSHLSQYMSSHLRPTEKSNEVRQLYFIDATNSFPLQQFQNLIPYNGEDENKRIYDNIRIITCLELGELAMVLNKIIQSIQLNKIKRQKNTTTQSEKPKEGNLNILIVVNGLETMFRNTRFKENVEVTHSVLRMALLKLRILSNERNGYHLRSLVLFPLEEMKNLSTKQLKRLKSSSNRGQNDGSSVGDYVCKYYVDRVIIM
ncbi:Csm2p NDAI_0B03870 [Naumovozyma dairenensis CBS 421]|uniref:DNA recombination and repair protein Rad51-like C-terminal domain-containing protein n=1 Tax=Naumovozyma dairenensis (strain ATCC 10597 / BCRC 20456 / CBS 421 / NBRC 0211 / NRRL Y-12639) TaxID=1071378 RepID=G0W6L0_NAUDC|nr:hypothetical protein NDAI_0B03870 [Naumovozyma dairenensis CBS 421]CCD23421.1 hypothetical protein NDAI_0B03870 [Naumovozyma dairenensis CBS 421]